MKNPAIFAAVIISLITASCSNDDFSLESQDNQILINATHPSLSRASDTGFDKGDKIGIFVADVNDALQVGGNMVNNGCFEFNGNSWSSSRKYFWNKGSYNVYAYYPHNEVVSDIEDYPFALPVDQSSNTGYSAADFLWAKAVGVTASASPVNLTFSHSLSRVLINLVKGDDYEGELPSDMSVLLMGTYTSAKIDLSTGGAVVDTQSQMNNIKAKKLSKTQYSAIVVPQRVDSRRPLVEVVAGNVSYVMEGTISFKAGMQHTITVTLSKSPEQVEIEIGGGIGTWN